MPWGTGRQRGKTTAQRGYGSAHVAIRKARVAAATPSTPCSYCGQPLGPDRSKWHLPHTPDRSGYEPGLVHARCNTQEAARRGAAISNAQRRGRGYRNPRW